MKRNFFPIVIALAGVMFSGCECEFDAASGIIKVDQKEVALDNSTSNSQEFTLSSIFGWQATAPDWIALSQTSSNVGGHFVIAITPSASYDGGHKSGVVIFKTSTGISAKVNVVFHDFGDLRTFYLTDNSNDYFAFTCECGSEEIHDYDGTYDLTRLLSSGIEDNETIVLKRDFIKENPATDIITYMITKPITIKGAGATKPVVQGSFRIDLALDEERPATIENLEIMHNALIGTGTNDERRGIMLRNGGAIIKNNSLGLVHPLDAKVTSSPSGIQVGVLPNSTVADRLVYVIEENMIGPYPNINPNAVASTLNFIVNHPSLYSVLHLSHDEMNEIFEANSVHSESPQLMTAFDFVVNKYVAGVFSTEAAAKRCLDGRSTGTGIWLISGYKLIEIPNFLGGDTPFYKIVHDSVLGENIIDTW